MHPLVCYPVTCKKPRLCQIKPWSWELCSSHRSYRSQNTWVSLLQCLLAECWNRSGVARTHTWLSGLGCWHPDGCVITVPNAYLFFAGLNFFIPSVYAVFIIMHMILQFFCCCFYFYAFLWEKRFLRCTDVKFCLCQYHNHICHLQLCPFTSS